MDYKKKAAFYTLGCRVNQYETESLKTQFTKRDYEVVEFNEKADVYVVNTCTVTNIADRKNRNILRRAKKINSDAIVVATGCYAQTNPKDLEKMSEVDFVVGQSDKNNISELVNNFEEYKNLKKVFVGNAFKYEKYDEMDFASLRENAKAYVKIQDGCDRFCAFCKIPFARGRKRSRDISDILKECRDLVIAGYKEIVLIGIHLGAYGEDLDNKTTFDDVLEKILEIDGLKRLRISSIYPDTVTDRFIELLKNKKLMPHLHISIQSADDLVLKMMRRRYDSTMLYNVLDKVRNNIEHIAFTGDVIVGFPYEAESNFLNTYNFINEFNFSDVHIFPYSDREKTIALGYKSKVNPMDKYDRFNRLNNLRKELTNKFLSRYLDEEVEILVEYSKNSKVAGYTKNFLKTKVENCDAPLNEIIKFKPKKIVDEVLIGEYK